jgi:hypothetical protein
MVFVPEKSLFLSPQKGDHIGSRKIASSRLEKVIFRSPKNRFFRLPRKGDFFGFPKIAFSGRQKRFF